LQANSPTTNLNLGLLDPANNLAYQAKADIAMATKLDRSLASRIPSTVATTVDTAQPPSTRP
jgi:hypothetical protein